MNSKNPHHKDALIDQGIEAMRAIEPREERVRDALAAMRSPTAQASRFRLLLPVGLGTAAVVAVVLFASFGARKADAAELHRISDAQRAQKTRHTMAYLRGKSGSLYHSFEQWLDGDKYKELFWNESGSSTGWNGFDGKFNFGYWPPNPEIGTPAEAMIDDAGGMQIPLETVESYMNIPAIKGFVRTSNVLRDGQRYDFYSFGNGVYKLYVNAQTRLPMIREIFDHGTLIERDIYDYPTSFVASTFTPPPIDGLEYYNYPRHRVLMANQLLKPGLRTVVGGSTIELKALVVGTSTVNAILGGAHGKNLRVEIAGVRCFSGSTRAFVNGLVGCSTYITPGATLTRPIDVQVSVVDTSGMVLGSAKFRVDDPFYCPNPERLIWPSAPAEGTAKAG